MIANGKELNVFVLKQCFTTHIIRDLRKKGFFLCLMICFLSISVPCSAFAAAGPGKVMSFKAQAGDGQAVLSWKEVKKADGYQLVVREKKSGNKVESLIIKAGRTTATVKNLENSTAYSFRIRAYIKKSSGRSYGKWSSRISAVPYTNVPDKPVLEISDISENSVSIRWNKVDGATSYELYMKKPGSSKYKLVLSSKKTSYKARNLVNDKEYRFRLYAVHKTKKETFKSKSSSVKVTVWSRSRLAQLAKTVNTRNVNEDGVYDASVVYDRQTAKSYANFGNGGKAFESANNYLVWVNLFTQRTFLFHRASASSDWKMEWSTPCITGKLGSVTPYGVYQFTWASSYHQYSKGRYAQYLSFFIKNNWSVHTFMYPDNDEFENNPASFKQGFMASEGCVRLPRKYAKDIFDHCVNGAFVNGLAKTDDNGSTIVIH